MVLSGLEIEISALLRSASPVVPPKVSANPPSGLLVALGTYETNGLTATLDCPPALSTGARVSAMAANCGIRRELNTKPPIGMATARDARVLPLRRPPAKYLCVAKLGQKTPAHSRAECAVGWTGECPK